MEKLTEREISVRIASAKMGIAEEPKQKKPRYAVKAPKRAAHLKDYQYKKGQSGHPGGRPANAVSLTALLRKRLEDHPEDAEAIINALVVLAKRPSLTQLGAIQMTFDRTDGRVTEVHKIEGVLPVTLLFRPAEEVLALERGEVIDGEFKENTEGGQ